MNTPSLDLFQLIQSMSKTEKGYFKKYVSRYKKESEIDSLRLFNIIEKQKAYDEKAIIKSNLNKPLAKQLPRYKHYLYSLIMQSLRSYYAGNTSKAQIFEQIQNTEILIERGMFLQAKKSLKLAEKLAEKYEDLELLLLIIRIELSIELMVKAGDTSPYKHAIGSYKRHETILKKVEYAAKVHKQYCYALTNISARGLNNMRDEKIIENLKEIVLDLKRNDRKEFNSFESLRFYYWIGAAYYSFIGKYEESYAYYSKTMQHFDENPHQKTEKLRSYLNHLHNVLLRSSTLGKYNDYEKNFRMLHELYQQMPRKGNYDYFNLKILMMATEEKLFVSFRMAKFSRVLSIISEIEKNNLLERVEYFSKTALGNDLYQNKVNIISWVGRLLFYNGDHKTALQWYSTLWNDKTGIELYGQVYFSRLYSILIHYEQGNIDSVKYLINATKNIATRQYKNYQFENLFFESMLKLIGCNKRSERLQILKKMKTGFASLNKDHTEKGAFIYFFIHDWIDSKIEGKPISEVFREANKTSIPFDPFSFKFS